MCDIGRWLLRLHESLANLDAKQTKEYQVKFKKLSLILIRCTEFIKSKRPSSENSTVVNTVLNFGGELLFHEINQAKAKDLQDALRNAQNKLTGEVALLNAEHLKAETSKADLKAVLPDIFGCFLTDINQHLGEFKAGSRRWLFDVSAFTLYFLVN